jgi:hypothetical protein
MAKHYVNTIGTPIIVDTEIDISAATAMLLKVKKPSGVEVEWVSTRGPANEQGVYTQIQYIIVAGDWDEPGFYTLHAWVELGGWRGPGDAVNFEVHEMYT